MTAADHPSLVESLILLACGGLIPPAPDVAAALSAVGALISDLRAEFSLTLYTDTGAFDFEGVNGVLAQIEAVRR